MEYMKTKLPDKHFELAIVDPPYGINQGETFGGKNWKEYKRKTGTNALLMMHTLHRFSEYQKIKLYGA